VCSTGAREAPCISVANAVKLPHRSGIDYDRAQRCAGARVMVCRKCLVGGRVQGVFYRATAAQRARELGVAGHARNLPDGRVEVLACGEAEAVRVFIDWLWTGSSASKVTSVEVSELAPDDAQRPAGFRTG
jgi:acylphosphatase